MSETSENMSLQVRVNGAEKEIQPNTTVAGLLDDAGLDPRTVAVELNGEIIRRPTFGEQVLQAGDRVEIVRFVQGG